MPTIRISDESMQRLKAWAEPLMDSADSALAKALDAAERYRQTQAQAVAGTVERSGDHAPGPPEETVREPLMDVIYERGGRASGRDLYPAIKRAHEALHDARRFRPNQLGR